MRLWAALLLMLQIAYATNRVVVTFDTWELAARPYDLVDVTIVKQYGRRMVLDLGRKAELPEAWISKIFGVEVTVELDALVMVNQDTNDFYDDYSDLLEDTETTTQDEPETTETPLIFTAVSYAMTPAANITLAAYALGFSVNMSSLFNAPWNLADAEPYSIHVENTWKTTNSTPNVFVAVLDTGLAQVARGVFLNLAQGYDFVSDESISLDADGRDIDPTDPDDSGPDCPTPSWHGTKVMSILAAEHGNAFGVLGVAHNASIIPVRVLGQCSTGYANDITDAVVWAAGGSINGVPKNPNPAKIISMSFAGSGPCPSYLQSAVNQAVGLGAFLVAAAGNEGLENIDDTFPANCKNVLSVGASTRRGKLAAYSNKGSDIAAPGGDVEDPIHVLSVQSGKLSDSFSMGTSMAVPHVAGVAALHILREVNFSQWTFLERHLSVNVNTNSSAILIVRSSGVADQWTSCSNGYCYAGSFNPLCAGYCSSCDYGTYNPNSMMNWPIYINSPNYPWGEYTYAQMYGGYPAYARPGYKIWYYEYSSQWRATEGDFGNGYGWTVATGFTSLFGSVVWCYRAPVGNYINWYNAQSYAACPAGTYASNPGTVNCDVCPSGQFSGVGWQSCLTCPAGQYSGSGSGGCTNCDPGTYSGSNAGGCLGCPAGQYSGAGAAGCTACPAGTGSTVGSGSCSACVAGKYSASGICTSCPAGQYSASSASSCTSCPAGKYSVAGSSTCTTCPAGQYSGVGAGACTSCPAGQYSAAGAASCTGCLAGQYAAAGASSCPSCAAGYYSAAGAASCIGCSAGKYSPAGAAGCTNCPAGQYSGANAAGCTNCLAGQYSASGAAACSNCLAGQYSAAGAGACSACPAGQYSGANAAGCTSCLAGQYSASGAAACSNCLAGQYSAAGAGACSACLAGQYSGANAAGCTNCLAGQYSAASATACSNCLAGQYSAAGANVCTACAAGKYNSAAALTICSTCAVGKFAATTGLTLCSNCAAGKYASAVGLVTCADCVSGSTYASSVQSTACLSCTLCDGFLRYQYGSCTVANDTMCCNNIVGTGLYASSCDGTANCPVLKNGNYINSGVSKLNKCMDFACNAGYYSPPTEMAKANTLCNSFNFVLNSTCAPYLNSTCAPATTCPSGVSTVLRMSDGTAILNTTNNDVQCTKCVQCMPGTVQISPCIDSTQTVCAICATLGLYAGYPWNGRCMYYSTTPGTMTLSQTPAGYFPYTLSYSSNVVKTIVNNTISYPTKKVDSFSLDPVSYSMTTSSLTSGFSFSLNIFISCASPPPGRRFKAWTTLQTKGATVACTSITNCSNFQAQCDLAASTECIGWDSSIKQGWYASNPGECTQCPNSSSYSTCNWGFYRNLSDCRPDRVADCFPCHGTLPLNAVWTTSRYPHHFDDSESNPCNWDCDKGFYKDGATCKACTKPENSEFDYGPFIGYGNSNPPPKTCLDPATCKYFGGVSGYGCAWKCPNGYLLFTPQPGYGDPRCIPCPTISCRSDETVVFVDTCNQCQKCDNIVANAVYQAGCMFTCALGYYMSGTTNCAPCSVQTCNAGQYSGGCGDVSDSTCIQCTACPVGYSASTSCSATEDTVCSPCKADLVAYSTYDSNCKVVCKEGYVMSSGGKCLLCATSDSSCRVGQKKATLCTADNLGCESCAVQSFYNWCWTAGLAPCLWDCGPGYRKLNGACIADASKTANPCLSEVFVTPAVTPSVTPPVTSQVTPPETPLVTPSVTPLVTPSVTPLVTHSVTPLVTSSVTSPPTSPITTPSAIPTPNVTANSTQENTTQVTLETLTVANLTISQCLCSSAQVARQLSALYQTTVLVVSCATETSTVECTDFVCPCTGNRRRLLQVDVTQYVLAYKLTLMKPEVSAVTRVLQSVVPTAVVTSTQSELLGTTTLDWVNVASGDSTGALIAGVLFVAAVGGALGYIVARKRPQPVVLKVINHTIDPNDAEKRPTVPKVINETIDPITSLTGEEKRD